MIIAVGAAGFGIFYNYLFGSATHTEIDRDDLGAVEYDGAASGTTDINYDDPIVNIALFGIDLGDEWTEYGRSDSIMVMSVNRNTGTIKLISVLRDTKAEIEGLEPQKINAAYENGGPVLAIKTLNSNFGLNIKDYISVNFGELTRIIDDLGGVDIYITADEAAQINASVAFDENNQVTGVITDQVSEGKAHLNGAQALAYARIRVLDSDYYRADRQHKVLTAIFAKIMNMSAKEYPAFIHDLMSISETSLDPSDILALSTLAAKHIKIETYTVPDAEYEENLFGGLDETGSWVWIYDLDKAGERIKTIIYGKENEEAESTQSTD